MYLAIKNNKLQICTTQAFGFWVNIYPKSLVCNLKQYCLGKFKIHLSMQFIVQ